MSSATANRKYLVYTEGNIPMKRPADSEVCSVTLLDSSCICIMNCMWFNRAALVTRKHRFLHVRRSETPVQSSWRKTILSTPLRPRRSPTHTRKKTCFLLRELPSLHRPHPLSSKFVAIYLLILCNICISYIFKFILRSSSKTTSALVITLHM